MPIQEGRPNVAERGAALGTLAPGPTVLVATDGSACADGALSLALSLAHARGAVVRLISVVEPTLTVHATRTRRAQLDVDRRERRLADVHAQLARIGESFPVDEAGVVDGEAVATIASAAAASDASVLALGLHSHGIIDRVFRDETALRVLRRLRCPLLAVTPAQRGLPHDAVAAVDFGPSSLEAAREAATLLTDGARLRLVHVVAESEHALRLDVLDRLDTLAAELASEHGLEIECVLRRGSAYAELGAELRANPTQLVALGCRRCTSSDPARGGRLTSAYVRAAGVSLVVGAPTVSAVR